MYSFSCQNVYQTIKWAIKLLAVNAYLIAMMPAHANDTLNAESVTLAPNPVSNHAPVRKSRIAELPELLNIPSTLYLKDKTPDSDSVTLTLQKAIVLGVDNSFTIKAAAEHRESFHQTTRAALGALLPRFDIRASQGAGRVSTAEPSEVRNRKENSLTLHQTLFDLSSFTEYRRQEQLTEVARVQMQGAISNTTLDVSSAYLKALETRLIIAVNDEYNQALNDLLVYMNNRTESGGASVAERDRVKARVANAQSQLADNRANLRTAIRNLSILIGEDPLALNFDTPILFEIPDSLEMASNEAKIGNRELLAANKEIKAVELEKKIQILKVLPTLGVDVTHSQSVNAAGFNNSFDDNKVMVTMNWSVFNGGTDLAQSRAAGFRASEKAFIAQDMQRKIDQELMASYAVLDSVTERYALLTEELKANRAVVEAFKAQLTGGNRPLLDVLDAYERLQQNKIEVAQLVVTEAQSHLKVAHLSGRLTPTDEVQNASLGNGSGGLK